MCKAVRLSRYDVLAEPLVLKTVVEPVISGELSFDLPNITSPMQLYAGSTSDFLTDSIQHRMAEKLGDSYYQYYRYRASVSEFNSWQNSLTALTTQLQYAGLRDQGIALELQLPLTSARLDALITGRDGDDRERAVIVELKQWTAAEATEIDDVVLTQLGGQLREVPHPSLQVARYRQQLADTNSAFHEGTAPIGLDACSWLHNLGDASRDVLRSNLFETAIARAPLFTGHDAERFRDFLQSRVGRGPGMPVLERVVGGRYAPSKKLLEHTARVIAGEPDYTLLDDQIVAFNSIMTIARKGLRTKSGHAVIVIKGGPGTGKSVLALNVMGDLLKEGKSVQHATGSKAFTENLREKLTSRSRPLLQYFNSYGSADPGVIDVLVCDESHRIRKTSNNLYTPKAKKTDRPQIDELIGAARLSVFFIDDHQAVRTDEVGSSSMIREAAVRNGASYRETELHTQFRCAGSERYVDWLDQLLEIRKTGETHLGADSGFDFRVFDSPQGVEAAIRAKAGAGVSARMAAGFCWPWSSPNADGTLVDDVVVGEYRRPWNAKPDAARLKKGIPKASFWASDPGGIDQIGCVYTAQGFEFDYVGVIFGRDLRYDTASGRWIGDPSHSRDHVVKTRSGPRFTDNVRNTYRVLLTRGMQGCYVYFMDEATRAFVLSRL